MKKLLLLPGEPGFNEILAIPPPSRDSAYIVPLHLGGVMVAVDPESKEFETYMEGGEYAERIEDIGDSWLFLPEEVYVDID